MKVTMKIIRKKIKFLLFRIIGKFNYLKKTARIKRTVRIKSKWYGNNYGGFYAFQMLINENSIVYSFGIGEDISFDEEIIYRHNCKVYGFDPTPKSINWVKSQPTPKNFKFYEYGIGVKDEVVEFYLPQNPNHVSGSIIKHNNINKDEKIKVELKSLKTILQMLNHKHIDVLKMDIEGAEYSVLESILLDKIPIAQILVEFHERFIENGKDKTISLIKMMRQNDYEIFGVSETFEEISFINKNVLQQKI